MVDFHLEKKDDTKYFLHIVEKPRKRHLFKSLSNVMLTLFAEMNDSSAPDSYQLHEELVSQLLSAENSEEIHDILSDNNIIVDVPEDLQQVGNSDSNLEATVGSVIPQSFHHRLEQKINNDLRAEELVGYEEEEGTIVFARIVCEVECKS